MAYGHSAMADGRLPQAYSFRLRERESVYHIELTPL
jgi:hypothetical protein